MANWVRRNRIFLGSADPLQCRCRAISSSSQHQRFESVFRSREPILRSILWSPLRRGGGPHGQQVAVPLQCLVYQEWEPEINDTFLRFIRQEERSVQSRRCCVQT